MLEAFYQWTSLARQRATSPLSGYKCGAQSAGSRFPAEAGTAGRHGAHFHEYHMVGSMFSRCECDQILVLCGQTDNTGLLMNQNETDAIEELARDAHNGLVLGHPLASRSKSTARDSS